MRNIVIYKLAKYSPSAGFPSPSGGVVPSGPIWETAAFGGGERNEKKKKKKTWGAMGAHIWGVGAAPVGASAYAAFGGDKNKI